LHLLVRILYACITIASRLTRRCTLRYSHTRRSRLHCGTQRPRITSVRIASKKVPAVGTRIRAGCRIYHTAGIDTEAIAIAADLGRVASTWHRTVAFWRRKTPWQAVVTIAFGAIFKTLRRRLDFNWNRGFSCSEAHTIVEFVRGAPTRTCLDGLNTVVPVRRII